MTVYVDDMYRYPMGQFRRMKMSHMIADTPDELHTMADKIGVARRWYQSDHYDIAISKRALAIEHGAVAVTLKQLACMSALQKRGMPMGPPETAIERRLALPRLPARLIACTRCNGSGEIATRCTFPMSEVGPGPVPDDSPHHAAECPDCRGAGKVVSING